MLNTEVHKSLESDRKHLIICETLKLVDNQQNNNIFPPETFEKVAAIVNSKFFKIFEKTMEKLLNQNISKKIKIKLLKIITCFFPSSNVINYIELRKLISDGLPDELPELRSILWKLFLNYFPNNLTEWVDFSREKNEDYERLKQDLLHHEPEKYKTLIFEITSDVTRTRTDMNFFSKTKDNTLEELLKRILLVFAILHPDISYIQGMNEILATIYFCFAKSNEIYLESDLFYCFENFMLEVKDIYLKDNDNSSRGIHGIVRTIENLLEYQDFELFEHFKNIGIEINFFALRWILIFFSQEFFMPETLRLWDSLIIESDKFRFITYVCISILTKKREELLKLGFADVMFSLQNLKSLDFTIDDVLVNAREIEINLDKMYQLLI